MATRTERVVLEYESGITTGAARDAAAVALLKRELGGLDGSNRKTAASTRALSTEQDRLSTSAVRGRNEIDRYSGRLTVLAQVAAGLGPSLIPIAAVGIPAAAGLANELSGVALSAGTALLAFHGVGEALTALNKAALDPTVTNLDAAQLALDKLPSSARDFARELAAMEPALLRVRESAAQGLFPGLEDSLNVLRTRTFEVQKILFAVGSELGDLSRSASEALAGPEWDDFFAFVAREAPRALHGLGQATGDVVHGLAELWMAFTPLNHDFTGLIEDAANGFDRWASGLAETEGFTDFIDYLRTNGPLVADAVTAIANAVLQIVEAAAPLGGPILQALTAVANVVAELADSKAGPAILATVTALSILTRAQATFGKVAESSWGQAIRGANGYVAQGKAYRQAFLRGSAAAAGLAFAVSGLADNFGLANTATLALTGSIAGPWGAAAGVGVGLLLDLGSSAHRYDLSSQELTATLNQQTGAITKNTAQWVAQQLEQNGLLARGHEFGLSVQQVTGYVLGQKAATDQVNAAMAQYDTNARIIVGRGGNLASTLGGQATSANSFADALDATRDSAEGSIGSFRRQQEAAHAVAGSFDEAKSAAERFRDEVNRVNALLEHRASLRDYQQALDDLADRTQQRADILRQIRQAQDDLANAKTPSERQAARDQIKALEKQADALKNSLDITTQAGRDTQSLIDGIAKAAITTSQTFKGMERQRFLAQARKDFIEATKDILGSKKAAEDLADRLGLLNNVHAKPKIEVAYDEAVGGINRVKRGLDGLHDKTIHIRTTFTPHTGGTQIGLADGGPVPGARQPYGDKVLAALAPGEFVVSNRHGQADQNRDLLRAINARRYADGGTVAASRVSVNVAGATVARGGTEIDYNRLASTLAALRPSPPLYGDIHMQPHNYNEFRRQMDQDRALANVSGVRRD